MAKRGKGKGKGKGKARRSTALVNTNRALKPFAQRYITKLKYAQVNFLNVAGPTAYRFRLNSLYDPDFSGTGHQPYGFDQLSPLYNRYRVISCRYVVSAVDQAGQYITYATLPSNEQVNAISLSEMRENPRCQFRVQAPSAAMRPITGNVYLPSLVGRTKAQYMADDRYQSVVTDNPAEAAILNVYVQRMDEGINTLNVPLTVTLEYTVEFFDIKNFAQS